jgi:hypothetical protein
MTGPVTRNSVVFLLGTPQHTEGSLNDPVEQEELGFHFNEKWLYDDLQNDPAGVPERVIYWHRYDFVATMVRESGSTEWRADHILEEVAKNTPRRLSPIENHHLAFPDNSRYRQVSRLSDSRDLGGYVQDEATGNRIGEEETG